MDVLEDGIDPALARNVLRVVGNCVADHGEYSYDILPRAETKR